MANIEPETTPIFLPSDKLDSSDGRGLGIVSPKNFEPSRWHPTTAEGKVQYFKFVNLILGRIRAGESNINEVHLFFDLLNTDGEPAFWAPVPEFLPVLQRGE